ncbi:MAG: hypothetical protein PHF63_03360 [Herbinix sp.]|nr:hypothetical protein [Herbinix sp.]
MDFEYGLELKKSMFDEQREEFAFFSSALPYEKYISEFQLKIGARMKIS